MKKDREIRMIKHNGACVPLMFNPNADSLEFHAKVGSEVFKGTDSKTVVAQVYDYLDKTLSMMWIPVIQIQRIGSSYERAFCREEKMRHAFGYEAERFYVTTKPDGQGARLHWEQFDTKTEAERLMHSTWFRFTTIPEVQRETEKHDWKALINYDEDVWKGLTQLWEAFQKLEGKVVDLFTSDEGHAKLRLQGERIQKLLGEVVE